MALTDLRVHRRLIEHRAVAQLALVAMLAACSGEVRELSEGSAPRVDSIIATDDVGGLAGSQPTDTATGREQPTEAEPRADLITPDGWGPLRIGMTRAEVVAAAGEDANPNAVGGPDPDRCDEFRPGSAPAGIIVMVQRAVLTRISVSQNSDIRTTEGFGVGNSGSRVLEHYGSRAIVDRHQYWASPAMYITVWREAGSIADRRGIRYEIDTNGEVVHIRAGGPSIEYVEGCV